MRLLCLFWLIALSSGAAELDGRVLSFAKNGSSGFSLVASDASGISFTNLLADARSLTNQIYLNGSGVAAGDVDGDGLCDLYFCGLDNRNELYRNLGNWRFTNITDAAGVACADQASTGAAFADIDGDGDLDLLVNGVTRGTRLFLNDGQGHFKEATEQFGLRSVSGATSLALADIDGDGFLDLYVVNYRSSTFRDEPEKRFRVNNQNGRYELLSVDGRSATDPDLLGRFSVGPLTGLIENGEPDILYRNRAGKRFEAVNWNDGTFLDENGHKMSPPYDWGLSAMFHDINGDGAPDLYVCNDFQSEDRLWINDGHGRFRLATSHLRHTSLFSMGVDFADLDGDGRDEIFVADMLSRDHARRQTQLMERGPAAFLRANPNGTPQYSRNTLFWNRGDGTFAEIGQLSRVAASEWSWCPAFLDVDLDGYPDLIVTAGHARDAQNIDVSREIENARKAQNLPWRDQLEMRRRFPKLAFPLLAFHNNGDLTFAFKQAEWGFNTPQVAQGMALADLDNDGDLDLIVNCLNGGALLYRNNSSANRIAVRLRGNTPNSGAIGARVTVRDRGLPDQSQEITRGGRYLSSDDSTRSFAAGSADKLDIRVRWRNGKESSFVAIANRSYVLDEETASVPAYARAQPSKPLFEEVALNHKHEDQLFDDFQRQPLIPRKLSNLGPGISWFDIDGDGWEDVVVGAGRTGRIAVFKNDSGRFRSIQPEALCRQGTRDRSTLLGWQSGTNRSLLIGSANYEDGLTNGPVARQFNFNSGVMDDSLSGSLSSSGPLALGDPDGDGDLDLFVGGRVTAARYPEPASSRFFRNENGKLILDESPGRAFTNLGLVTAAIWSDLDDDGHPELLLACEFGPIRVFNFKAGNFVEITSELGLANWIGPWNSVTTGDFDNDGRMDIVAGNWGRNTAYNEHPPEAWHFYFAPAENNASTHFIEAYYDDALGKVVPRDSLDGLSQVFPGLLQRYPTFASFSTASIPEILGDQLSRFRELRVTTFDSLIFLNRGTNFVVRSLPLLAQVSPVFGLAVGDIDADGNEDLFLAQNFYGFKQDLRCDAGSGLLLLGNGHGEFSAASQSGITIEGEGRGAAFCDYDHDGRLDLAVGQNSAAMRLFHNAAPNRGVRVLFQGSPENPQGVGSSVRLRYSDGTLGPRHEVRAGEGYWSQAAATTVLGRAKIPIELQVSPARGESFTLPISESTEEIPVHLADTEPDSSPWPAAVSKKGLQVQMVDDALALGIKHAALNVNLAQLLELTGKTNGFSFQRSYVEHLDRQIKALSDHQVIVSLILLYYRSADEALNKLMLHPKYDPAAPNHLSAFNTTNPESAAAFRACIEFLAERYSRKDERHGRVWNYIVGNEVNSHWFWSNMGRVTMEEFADDYLRAIRICQAAVRKYSANARVYLSLEHHWNMHYPGGDERQTFGGKPFVDYFARRARETGDFDWNLAFHPYPENLFDCRTWNDKSALLAPETPRITFRNLEVLQRYFQRTELLFNGEPRHIILSEQGFHSPDGPEGQTLQAAAYCYAYYKVAHLDGIDSFILHRQVDHGQEGGLNLGLWTRNRNSANPAEPLAKKKIYEVFKAADQDNWEEAFRFALPVIGIQDWKEILTKDAFLR